ncbi:hypothetical protein E2562_004147, partial [Oryza meyeriana var. granulata]
NPSKPRMFNKAKMKFLQNNHPYKFYKCYIRRSRDTTNFKPLGVPGVREASTDW